MPRLPLVLALAALVAFAREPVLAAPQPISQPSAVVPAHASPGTSPTPAPDVEAERAFAKARDVWRARTDVPYVRYGALVRYAHSGRVVEAWWDAYSRSSDGALALTRLHDVDAENHRLRGVPFSIFGLKIFDTNADAEPIRIDDPRIDVASSFGVLNRFGRPIIPRPAASARPGSPAADFEATSPLREISRVEANTREYQIRVAGTETIDGAPALHLTLEPLRDPKTNRLRDLWLDPKSYRTVRLRVQGLLDGKPYDGVPWTVRYTLVDGRQYVQQVIADEPLRFGFDVSIPKFEIDFVDYHFPADVPKFTFDRPF